VGRTLLEKETHKFTMRLGRRATKRWLKSAALIFIEKSVRKDVKIEGDRIMGTKGGSANKCMPKSM
jgi:hypothetical protein